VFACVFYVFASLLYAQSGTRVSILFLLTIDLILRRPSVDICAFSSHNIIIIIITITISTMIVLDVIFTLTATFEDLTNTSNIVRCFIKIRQTGPFCAANIVATLILIPRLLKFNNQFIFGFNYIIIQDHSFISSPKTQYIGLHKA